MAKVHMVNTAATHAAKIELEGATPIHPLRAVALQFPAPQATDEWGIPSAPLSIGIPQKRRLSLPLLSTLLQSRLENRPGDLFRARVHRW